ncbi:MAG: hypothetical protein ACOYCE_08710 [Limnochordia bacterium]|jgi:hypothetical protein
MSEGALCQPLPECRETVRELICVEYEVAFTVDADCRVIDVKPVGPCPKDQDGCHHKVLMLLSFLITLLLFWWACCKHKGRDCKGR